jgi:hypothetical protein|tara:strand:- start:4574 stop:5143 length:570 start_codon:yes stop_codon:yes gene_type:complete
MSLPKPINWMTQPMGAADWLFYQQICRIIKSFDSCGESDVFKSLFQKSVVDFETLYPAMSDDATVPSFKLKVYQQILSQLPIQIGSELYDLNDMVECEFIPNKILITQSISSLINDEEFSQNLWDILSLGLKICNYQDKGLAAMRETMTVDWIQAQENTPMVINKNALITLTSKAAGKHGFEGLGSLFG